MFVVKKKDFIQLSANNSNSNLRTLQENQFNKIGNMLKSSCQYTFVEDFMILW